MTKDCTQPLRIGNIRALNGCAGILFGAAALHNHKNSADKSNRKPAFFAYEKTKAHTSFHYIVQFLYFLNLKFQAYSHFLRVYSTVPSGRGGLVVNTSDSGSRGRGFEPHSGRCVVSLSKTYLPPKKYWYYPGSSGSVPK